MKHRLTFLYLLFLLTELTAQQPQLHVISGSVLDAQTREPIVAATVAWQQQKTLTDTLGKFWLQALSGTSADLHVRCMGYQPWTGPANFETIILLQPDDNLLGAVVISATMKEVQKDASPIPVEIYTPRFFQKNASPSIFEALSAVNGVRPQLNCNVCNTGDIHINGMEGPYTMVTIDGMPIVSGLSSVYGLSGIPNGMVERIEVVKGPASTLYGSEAVGGMVNVITKNVDQAPRLFADLFVTSNQEFNADLAWSGRVGKAGSLVGVNYFNFQNPLDINEDNFTDVTLQHRVSVFNKWRLPMKNKRAAALGWRYIYENRWGGELQWTPEWRGTDSIYGESIYTNRVEVLGKIPLDIQKQAFNLDLSWNLHDQNSVYGVTTFLGRQQVGFAQLTTAINPGSKHQLLLGAALRYTWYDDNTPATFLATNNHPAQTWLPGLFLQDEISLNDRHVLLAGLRYDYNSIHGNILTPRISWKWSKNAQHILRLTGGSGYRVANIFTEDHAALTGARTVIIKENLQPERSWNANLNYIRKFYPKQLGFISLDGSLFFTHFTNQILPDYESHPDQIIYANLNGHAVSTGASLNLEFNLLNGVKLIGGATFMEVYRVEQQVRHRQFFAPPFSGSWTLSWPIPAWKLNIDYTGNLNSPMRLPTLPNDPRPEYSPWFSIHNIQLTSTIFKHFELYAGVKNLFGFFPREEVILRAFDPFDKHIAVDNPLGLSFDPTYNYAPIQRQRLVIGIRYQVKH